MTRALFVLFLLWATPAVAGDWRFLGLSQASSKTLHAAVFIDVASLQRHGNLVRYWIDQRLSVTDGSGRYQFNRVLDLQEVDCDEHKYRALSSAAYLDAEFKLDLEPTGKWKYAAPDTYKNSEILRICTRKWGDTPLDRDRAAKGLLDAFHDDR